MTIDLTQIILAIIALISAVLTGFVIPWLKNKLTDHQYETLAGLVRVGVYAAEQLFTSVMWKEKKQYVVDLLQENGYKVDVTAVDALIEATVRELRIEQGGPKAVQEEQA
jgi:Na+-translocating ferredoxin:NAD+ oxidoreductase RnfG subunit